jgi:RecJ-like exonuclease
MGKKICPECKGNGYIRKNVHQECIQCLNCWSEGEIDEKIWARDFDPIIPNELQSEEK